MRRKAPEPPIEATNQWWCLSCEEQEPREQASMLEHLSGAHGIASPIKGNRRMLLHLDEARRYVSTYEWAIGDVKAQQIIVGPRRSH